jgi:hypothetical protein
LRKKTHKQPLFLPKAWFVSKSVLLNYIFMKILSTRTHGVLDYLVGILLIASPWIFNFARDGAETWVPVILGAAAIVYSLLTNYEMGAFKTLSMRTHLNLDMLSGALLAISPWVFRFNEYVFLPHLILGIAEIGVALITDPVPAHSDNTSETSGGLHRHAH